MDYLSNKPRIVIENIVSSVNLECKLDLEAIALRARNAEYNPKRFHEAVIMRMREPKTSALIFGSGKMLCSGAKTEGESKIAARKYARIIQKLGFPVKFSGFKTQKFVGCCDVNFPIGLEKLMLSCHGACSIYEPEISPGLIYKMKDPRVSISILPSGKLMIAGTNAKEDIFKAFENIYPVLRKYKRVIH